MAAVITRPRKDGSTAYLVRWRLGGGRDAAWQSETFSSARAAREFKRDVEAADHLWPDGWVKGHGYLLRDHNSPAAGVTLQAFGTEFITELTAIGPDTRQRYLNQIAALAKQFAPIVGHTVTVADLTESHIRRWINARTDAGAKPKTIANYHGLLFAVMVEAIRAGLRHDNPCAQTKLPRRDVDIDTDENKVFLTEKEFAELLPHVSEHYRAMVQVAVGTGLRYGELTALQVRDLDLDSPIPRLSVRRAWKRNGTGDQARPGLDRFYLGKPKSKKARRRITLAPVVVDLLRDAVAGKAYDELVFTAVRGGRIDQAKFYEYVWKPAVKAALAAGLRVKPRFHDLRHTHAAWLISANVPLPVIQQRLGHESITTTVDTYGGLLVQAHEVADAAIEAALTGGTIAKPRPVGPVPVAADLDVQYDANDQLPDDEEDAAA